MERLDKNIAEITSGGSGICAEMSSLCFKSQQTRPIN